MEILIQRTKPESSVLNETILTEEFSNSPGSEDIIKAPANIYEDDEEYRIELLMPGFTKDDFEIEVTGDGVLNISTLEEEKEEPETETILRNEFNLPGYVRSFQVPDDSLSDEIVANYEGGILFIILPKEGDLL